MLWLWVIVIVVLIGAVAVVAAGSGGSMSEVYDDRPDATLPSRRPLTADDLQAVRLNTGVRGYRMDEVDALLARIGAEMLERESQSVSDSGEDADQDTGISDEAGNEVQSTPDRHVETDSTGTDETAPTSTAPPASGHAGEASPSGPAVSDFAADSGAVRDDDSDSDRPRPPGSGS